MSFIWSGKGNQQILRDEETARATCPNIFKTSDLYASEQILAKIRGRTANIIVPYGERASNSLRLDIGRLDLESKGNPVRSSMDQGVFQSRERINHRLTSMEDNHDIRCTIIFDADGLAELSITIIDHFEGSSGLGIFNPEDGVAYIDHLHTTQRLDDSEIAQILEEVLNRKQQCYIAADCLNAGARAIKQIVGSRDNNPGI